MKPIGLESQWAFLSLPLKEHMFAKKNIYAISDLFLSGLMIIYTHQAAPAM